MCKEDITIGRRLVAVTSALTLTAGVLTRVLGPRPDRVAVILAVSPDGFTTATESVRVGVNPDNANYVVSDLTATQVRERLDIRDYGQIVTGAIYLQPVTANDINVGVTELFLTVPLEDV